MVDSEESRRGATSQAVTFRSAEDAGDELRSREGAFRSEVFSSIFVFYLEVNANTDS